MHRAQDVSSRFAIAIGAFLLIEGTWGLFSPVVFGVLTTNTTHAVIHIILGVVGIWTGIKGGSRGFCMFLGILLIAVGVLRFIPGVGELIVTILNVNPTVAWVNIAIGIVSLLVALAARPARVAAAQGGEAGT